MRKALYPLKEDNSLSVYGWDRVGFRGVGFRGDSLLFVLRCCLGDSMIDEERCAIGGRGEEEDFET